jgi:hypothetical protein
MFALVAPLFPAPHSLIVFRTRGGCERFRSHPRLDHGMAIYSLNVATVGKSTHASGTAGAHLLYIAREHAATHVEAENMPTDAQEARTWMDSYERAARSNARLMTKVRIALPREIGHAANVVLTREFIAGLTGGRVPAYFAIHDQGEDAANPHAHIVLIDRDIQTGKRVLMLSDSPKDRIKAGLPENGVSFVRERWEHQANQALARAGQAARIDRRSLLDQGLTREAQIHMGPRAQHIDSQVRRPESKVVPAPTPRHPDRVINYPVIDKGRTRRERNAEIIGMNLERDIRSPLFETRVWAQFERDQRVKDKLIETRLMAAARRRTLEERRIRRAATVQLQDMRAKRDAEARLTRDWLRQRHAPEAQALKTRHASERADLKQQQDRLFARFFAAVDLTGRIRRRRDTARMALSARHKTERAALSSRIQEGRTTQAQALEARYRPEMETVGHSRAQKLAALHERHEAERVQDDQLLQVRARDREGAREAIQRQIETWKRLQQVSGGRSAGGAADRLIRGWRGQQEDAGNQDGPEASRTPREIAEGRRTPRPGKDRDRDRGPER